MTIIAIGCRVNFKGCVEKNELLRILERLWRQEQRHKEEGDTMDDDSMCKICMDSPVAFLYPLILFRTIASVHFEAHLPVDFVP